MVLFILILVVNRRF